MFKISAIADISSNDTINFQYQSGIVPIIGDIINHNSVCYRVTRRTLFTDNLNFIIIHVEKY